MTWEIDKRNAIETMERKNKDSSNYKEIQKLIGEMEDLE